MLRLIGLVIVTAWLPLGEVDGQSVTQELEYLRDQPQLPLALPPPTYPKGAQVDAHVGDSLALVELYNSTGGSSTWKNRSGWLEGPVAQWHGISLTNQGRVRQISLRENGLSGPLPTELGLLTELTYLHLRSNSLIGTIPSELGNLTKLTWLDLAGNDLSGPLPTELGELTELGLLDLDFNSLTGTIPPELGNLKKLKWLALRLNNLSGQLPAELGLLTELELLGLQWNSLTGTIPSELGNLTKLRELDLLANDLSGQLPTQLGLLSELEDLHLGSNALTGTIPSELGNLTKLKQLTLGSNNLSGVIPPELGNLSNLERLSLSWNGLSGAIPPEIGNLSKLRILYLKKNDLSGSIPPQLGQLTALTYFYASENNFSGTIPVELGQLTELSSLTLNHNDLSGAIPPELGNLGKLKTLILSTNNLSGAIPPELGNLGKLKTLSLSANNLSGALPKELGQLSELLGLYLSGNNLSGSVPQELAQISTLENVSLRQNQFSGPVPDLTGLSQLDRVAVQDNQFLFADLLPNKALSSLEEFTYAPQDSIDTQLKCESAQYVFTTPATAEDNKYQWYRDGMAIPGQESPTLKVGASSTDQYHVSITNNALQDLTLYSRKTRTNSIAPCETRQFAHVGDSLVLVDLYNSTQGSGWTTKTGWLQTPVSDWFGITLNNQGRVTDIALGDNNLEGSLPTKIGDLDSLQVLSLASNRISGTIPKEMGQLSKLQQLTLKSNQLTGAIPSELGQLSELWELYLSGNNLAGNIPSQLGGLAKLQLLELNYNELTGTIPPQLGQLSVLTILRLRSNDLSGSIPRELGQLSKLSRLNLADNDLSGSIPQELGQLSELSRLNLSGNNLSGSVHQDLAQLSNLRFLYLYQNQLSGVVPNLTGLNRLSTVLVQDNQFLFADLLPNKALSSLEEFTYAPQDSIDTQLKCEAAQYVFTTPATAQGNAYKWYRDGEQIANEQTNILRVSATDNPAVYHASITNSELQDLTLYSRKTSTSSADPCQTRQFAHEGDSLALVELYKSTKGSAWTTRTGWLLAPVSDWHGITLSSEGRVTDIALENNNLDGSLPNEIGDLDSLRVLSLASNGISGIIPSELGQLSKLWQLTLKSNQLTGAIPSELGQLSKLFDLNLTDNNLSGAIPKELGQLSRLDRLDLGQNQLGGSIPRELGQLSELYGLNLSGNNLSGTIPPELGQLVKLGELDLHENDLSGTTPRELGQLSQLYSLDLSDNTLSGSVPQELAQISTLEYLYLNQNQFSGLVPNLTGLSLLDRVRVQDNRFLFKDLLPNATLNPASGFTYAPQDSINTQLTCEGSQYVFSTPATAQDNKYQWYRNGTSIPGQESPTLKVSASSTDQYHASITNSALSELTLYSRKTSTSSITPCQTGQFAHVGDSLALVELYKSTQGNGWTTKTNWLQAPVSEWFGITLSSEGRVTDIQLRGNNLTGTLPSDLGKLDSLAQLDLGFLSSGRNAISGAIPKELGQLSKLHTLVLSRNKFSDPIPPELGQLAELTELDLSYNQFAGAIPQELTRLTKLTGLYLHHNALNGEIPSVLGQMNLRELLLHGNKLTGNIPPELSQLSKLEDLRLYDNQLTGEIPPELGDLSELKNLRLNENDLSGSIPPELGNLSQLQTLNLRSNDLSGALPKELGQLSNLENLWLYDNHLSGSIPPELGNLSQLRILHLRINDLSGALPKELGQLSNLYYLNLYDNRLSGALPKELGELAALNDLRLNNNNFSGPVPDLTGLNQLNSVRVQDNQFLFADLLPNKALSSLEEFTYAPQDSIDTQLKCEAAQYVFTTPATAQGNAYKWYRDGEQIANEQTNTLRVSATDNPAVYHASITNSELQDLTLYSRKTSTSSADPCQTRQFAHEGDSLALVELYKSTKGSAWTTRTGWLQTLVSEWHGITLSSEGRVTNVALSENNLEGSLPEEIEDLDSLRVLSLADNVISGLMPDLTSLKQLGSVRVQDNRFLFKDLLPNATFNPASGFTYAPQDSINTQLTCEGSQYVFSTPATAQGNAYKWYRNGEVIGNEQTNTLRVNASSTGQYHASVTNNALSDLTLYSRKTSTSSSAPCQNSAPTIVNAIADQTIAVGGTYSVDLTTVFSDPDNDVLTFAAISGDEATATAAISNNTLTVTGVAVGTATITVSATDTQGSNTKVEDSFTVTVTSSNSTPTIVNAIADQTIGVGGTYSVDLTTVFSDPDNDVLTFAASSGDEATATAAISNNTLTVTGVAIGSATITVSATDENGSNTKVEDSFTVTVTSNNSPPTIVNALADQSVAVGASINVDLSSVFTDPNGDVLSLTAVSAHTDTATVSVSGNTLTVYGVAAGQTTVTVTATDGGGLSISDVFTVTVTSTARQFAHKGDSLVLVELYNSTEGNTWTRNTGWLQTPVSEWFGIGLDSDGRVTGVYLQFNNLVGQLPESMGTLAKLDSLLLPDNSLSGPIPPELGQLKELRELWLSFNGLSGAVPAELSQMTKLEELAMTGNQLTGPIPPELGQLANLKYLWLASNRLSGTIPSELRHLEKISVNANNLSGPIPTHLGEWANLIELHLCDNNFTGQIPPVLGQLSELEFLCLRNNQLSGSIPTELNQLSKLKTLWLHENHLSGPVPDLTSLSQLNSVRINTNQFLFADLLPNAALSRLREFIYAPQDTIETQLACRASEYVLTTPATAEDNRYQWYRDDQALNGARSDTLRISVMDSPADYHATIKHDLLPDLTLVSRKANTRDASACTRIAHVADSTLLVDFYNRTHGSLLWHNHTGWLEDPVVQWYGITLDASGRVTDINLPYNNLVGQLPLSRLDQLAHLRYLNVSGNQFSGTIPEELGDLTQLEYLMLSHNKLAGTIPRELADQAPLKVLDISGNQLAGEIPTELNQITTLQTFSVSANQLSGPVPDFTGLNQLDSLHVAQNEFFFMDLLPNASLTRLDDFVYAPQDSIDTFLSRTASGFAFTTAAKAMGNRYQWYRDDQPISGPQSDTLHVSLYADPAQYHATITNDRLPELTLVSRKKGVHDRVTMTETDFTEDILLHQSYPNPFAEATTVAFELGAPEYVRIVVYDLLGQVVATIADGRFAAGVHRIEFTGDHLASGQYLYRMEAGAYRSTRFMSVVR